MSRSRSGPLLALSLLLAFPSVPGPLAGQSTSAVSGADARPAAAPAFSVTRAPGSIRIDGVMDDPGWQNAVPIPLDWEWTPGDNTVPPVRSACHVTFDDDNLYLGCRAWDPDPGAIRARYFDRDNTSRLVRDDHFNVLIDPFNDQRRAFQFRISALGGQADALLSTAEGFEDFSWDAIWSSAGRLDTEGYVVEAAIPFRSLRFPRTDAVQTWGFIFERSWPRNVRHRMQSAPRDRRNTCLLCEANKLTGFQGITPGRNLEFGPTLTADRTDVRTPFPSGPMVGGDATPEFGMDLRWGISPNLSLNATANPDFSQVEADAAQLEVNTRFALFFPEKRPFFLEGADLFSTPLQAVFTRTVADPTAGLKLSGKVGAGSRTGFGVFAARDELTNLLLPATQGSGSTSLDQDSYTAVGRLRRDIGQSSYVGALYTGRFGDGYGNQVAGFDSFHQLTRSSSVRAQVLGSMTEYPAAVRTGFGQPAGTFTGSAVLLSYNYFSARWFGGVDYTDLSPRFRADVGFIPRVDTRSIGANGGRIFRQQRGWYNQIFLGGFYNRTHDHGGGLTDESFGWFGNYSGPLQSSGGLHYTHSRTRFLDRLYDLDQLHASASIQPTGSLVIGVSSSFGETIDFTNARASNQVSVRPSVRLSLGRGLGVDLSHLVQRLSHEGDEVFTANLFQSRVLYQFSMRTMVRGILQYRSVDRNPAKYSRPVNRFEEGLFGQFLFSYKVNPQTVLFLGYSENDSGNQAVDLTRVNRTFFAKVGYAWRP